MDERDPKTYAIIGAAMEVHKELGPGFQEPAYQESLAIEFGLRKVPFEEQVELTIDYKGHTLRQTYRPDYNCYGDVIVEIKALNELTGHEEAQVINYLKASKLETALLINFGKERLEWKRFKN